jgi:CTP:phosphocholine cytidylyltransferase-like protein
MQAIILCAGRGTRMGILTEFLPKPLLSFAGKTLLEYKLESLPDKVSEVIIVIGYLGEKIISKIGEEYLGRKIIYVKQKELLGTSHALHQARDFVDGNACEKFLVLMGDDIYSKNDLERLVNGQAMTMLMSSDGEYTGACVLLPKYFELEQARVPDKEKEFGIPQTLYAHQEKFTLHKITATYWKRITDEKDLAEKISEKIISSTQHQFSQQFS